jgi:hypothetical protein
MISLKMRETARPVVWELWRVESRQGHPISGIWKFRCPGTRRRGLPGGDEIFLGACEFFDKKLLTEKKSRICSSSRQRKGWQGIDLPRMTSTRLEKEEFFSGRHQAGRVFENLIRIFAAVGKIQNANKKINRQSAYAELCVSVGFVILI